MKKISQSFAGHPENVIAWSVSLEAKDQTIKVLVELIDHLRQPFNNSKRHDLYLWAVATLNELDENGKLTKLPEWKADVASR